MSKSPVDPTEKPLVFPPRRHPMQPLEIDQRPGASAVVRFKSNPLVRHLLNFASARGCSLNELCSVREADKIPVTKDDWMQLAQLIGYSVSGFGDLSYVDSETLRAADMLGEYPELTEQEARIQHLEQQLASIRSALKPMVAKLFDVHPDDLKGDTAPDELTEEGAMEEEKNMLEKLAEYTSLPAEELDEALQEVSARHAGGNVIAVSDRITALVKTLAGVLEVSVERMEEVVKICRARASSRTLSDTASEGLASALDEIPPADLVAACRRRGLSVGIAPRELCETVTRVVLDEEPGQHFVLRRYSDGSDGKETELQPEHFLYGSGAKRSHALAAIERRAEEYGGKGASVTSRLSLRMPRGLSDGANWHFCDECGAAIPDIDDGGIDNRHHKESCSLYNPATA